MKKADVIQSIVPRTIIIGKSTLSRIPSIISSLGVIPRTMVLTGKKTRRVIGEDIFKILEEKDYGFEHLIIEDSYLESAQGYFDIVQNYRPNLLICAGGGKTIDIGKYCLLRSDWQMELITAPTATSHDGIASPFIFLNDPTEKYIGECKPPYAIIADIDKIIQHPRLLRYLAAGVGDTVGKITAIWDWRHAHRIKSVKYSRFVGGVLKNADSLFQGQVSEALVDLEHGIQVVLKALLIAGVMMGTSNDIRVGYGSEHMFSAALDAELKGQNLLHGERVALGTILMAKLQGQNYEQIKSILETAGCPVEIDEFEEEISSTAIIQALQKAHKMHSMYTVLGQTGLTEQAAIQLAQSVGANVSTMR